MTNVNNYESEESHGSNYTSNKRYFLRIKPQFTIQKVGAAKISGALLKSLKRSVLAKLKLLLCSNYLCGFSEKILYV